MPDGQTQPDQTQARKGDRSAFDVRPATLTQIGALLEIERSARDAPHWPEEVYVAMVNAPAEDLLRRCVLVAADGEKVIGFSVGRFVKGDEAAGLESVVVNAPWRRRRVAHALCAAVVQWATQLGARRVELEVRQSNQAAQRLYAGVGFAPAGTRRGYYCDPEEDAILMARKTAHCEQN